MKDGENMPAIKLKVNTKVHGHGPMKAGSVIEDLDAELVKAMISDGTAEEHKPAPVKPAAQQQEKQEEQAEKPQATKPAAGRGGK
jgi:hypothetical protein